MMYDADLTPDIEADIERYWGKDLDDRQIARKLLIPSHWVAQWRYENGCGANKCVGRPEKM